MSFFIRGKSRNPVKRKFESSNNTNRKNKKPTDKFKKKQFQPVEKEEDEDEEIKSDDNDDEEFRDNASSVDFSDGDQETPQDKKLRLAKKYLEEIEKEEQNRLNDNVVDSKVISSRLKDDYLDSVGKLRREIADTYTGFEESEIVTLKHKLQKSPITCLCISADDKFMFSGSKSEAVVKWNLEDMTSAGVINCTAIHKKANSSFRSSIVSLALSSDFKFLAIADKSNDIQIWCPETLKHIHTFEGHRDIVTGLVFRKDTHELFSVSNDRSVKIWSLDEMAYVETMFGHQTIITGIDALSRERAITSGGTDNTIRIWKIVEESQLVYNGHTGHSIEAVKLINDEYFLSCGDDGQVCVWGSMKKKAMSKVRLAHGQSSTGEPNWVSSIATLLNTDIVASGSCDGFIRIWKLENNFRSIKPHLEIPVKGFVNHLSFSNDGTKLIAGIGQEHRLGRWWSLKEAKNVILIIPFTITSELK